MTADEPSDTGPDRKDTDGDSPDGEASWPRSPDSADADGRPSSGIDGGRLNWIDVGDPPEEEDSPGDRRERDGDLPGAGVDPFSPLSRHTARPRPGAKPPGGIPRPSKPLPLGPGSGKSAGGTRGKGRTAYAPEDDNREVKGCLAVLVVAALFGGAWWALQDVIDFGDDETARETGPSAPKPPPITRVESMREKTAVDHGTPATAPLARRLKAPEEETDGAGGVRKPRTTAALMAIADEVQHPTIGSLLEEVKSRSVCYQGQPAQQVDSLYGLRGGFAISYAPADRPEDSLYPRLEFLPPTRTKAKVLYYVNMGQHEVDGFDGRMAREVPDQPRAVGRVILSWIAEVADGECPDEGATQGAAPQ